MCAQPKCAAWVLLSAAFLLSACLGGDGSSNNGGDGGDDGGGLDDPLMDRLPEVDRDLLLYSQVGQDEDTSSDLSYEPVPAPEPPHGAATELDVVELETTVIDTPPVRLRSSDRPLPGGDASPKYDWRELRFSSASYLPEAGLGDDMQRRIAELSGGNRNTVYGFMIMEEYLSPARREELGSDYGVEFLGSHAGAHKVRVPLDTASDVSNLDYVYWLGFARNEQKQNLDMQQLLDERDQLPSQDVPNEVPLFISTFDAASADLFAGEIEALGVELGDYDPDIGAFRAMASWGAIEDLPDLDYVLFLEPMLQYGIEHDQSMPLVSADYIRPHTTTASGYGGAEIPFGVLDTGFMLGTAASTMHTDLNKWGCGANFTGDGTSVWDDGHDHGTHVLTTVAGSGRGESRYTGIAPGVGSSGNHRIRAGQVFTPNSLGRWTLTGSSLIDGIEFMGREFRCGETGPRPMVINYSGGQGTASTRKMDEMTWENRQLYVVSAGNAGPTASSISSPTKNGITVGNVSDRGFENVGQIENDSSRGPTSDDRMKPNVVAPGRQVMSADGGTTDGYRNMGGTSMAAPHVAGMAITMMDHYSSFRWRPMLTRARMMSTAILHDDDTSLSDGNIYGFGRVDSYLNHWRRDNASGWRGHWAWGNVHRGNYRSRTIEVPEGTHRLVVVMTWDEPAASSGADSERIWDLELWLDHGDDCSTPRCGEYLDWSWDDNVIYKIIDRPAAGTWRLKAVPYNAPDASASGDGYALPTGIAAITIRGDTQPAISLGLEASSTVSVGEEFGIYSNLSASSYVLSGVHLENTARPFPMRLNRIETTRADGREMVFDTVDNFTLGTIPQGHSRNTTWYFEATSSGCSDLEFRAWSENGGTDTKTIEVCAE